MKRKRKLRWEAVIKADMSIIPIGWRGTGQYPLQLNGKYLKNPQAMARRIVRALNRGEV